MTKNKNHASGNVDLREAVRLGRSGEPLPEGARAGRIGAFVHSILSNQFNRIQERERAEGQRLFEDMSGAARGLNRDVLSTMSEIARSGLPGYRSDEIVRRPRHNWAQDGKPGNVAGSWTVNFVGNGEGPLHSSAMAIDLLAPGGEVPAFLIESPNLPGGRRSIMARSIDINYRAPTHEVNNNGAYGEVINPGNTVITIYGDTPEGAKARGDSASEAVQAGRNPDEFLGGSAKIEIGPDGTITGMHIGRPDGGFVQLETVMEPDVQVLGLLGSVRMAAGAMSGQIPDDLRSIAGPV